MGTPALGMRDGQPAKKLRHLFVAAAFRPHDKVPVIAITTYERIRNRPFARLSMCTLTQRPGMIDLVDVRR